MHGVLTNDGCPLSCTRCDKAHVLSNLMVDWGGSCSHGLCVLTVDTNAAPAITMCYPSRKNFAVQKGVYKVVEVLHWCHAN